MWFVIMVHSVSGQPKLYGPFDSEEAGWKFAACWLPVLETIWVVQPYT